MSVPDGDLINKCPMRRLLMQGNQGQLLCFHDNQKSKSEKIAVLSDAGMLQIRAVIHCTDGAKFWCFKGRKKSINFHSFSPLLHMKLLPWPCCCILFLCYRTLCNDKTRRLNRNMISHTLLGLLLLLLRSRLIFHTHLCFPSNLNPKNQQRWVTLSCENAMETCCWENYDHWVMRWNGLILLYLPKCEHLSNWTGLWITQSSYLVSLPDPLLSTSSASFHISETTYFFLSSSYHDQHTIHFPTIRYDLPHCFSSFT